VPIRARSVAALAGAICSAGPGCTARIPSAALALTAPPIEIRQRSTRRFDTPDEGAILSAVAGLLQDLGFTIDNSESELGLIVASKDRSAVEAGQVAAKVFHAVLFRSDLPIDRRQKFRASVVTRPAANHVLVRVTFQRIVWNDRGEVSRRERMDDAKLYQDFFARLSKAVFLEAQAV